MSRQVLHAANAAALSLLFLFTGAYAHHPSIWLALCIGVCAGWVVSWVEGSR